MQYYNCNKYKSAFLRPYDSEERKALLCAFAIAGGTTWLISFVLGSALGMQIGIGIFATIGIVVYRFKTLYRTVSSEELKKLKALKKFNI